MTIKEIAKKANVSIASVSLALNNKAGIGDETRERIIRIANECGYKPYKRKNTDALSGNIRFIKYSDSGLIVDRSKEHISEIIDSVESELRNRGMNLLLTTFITKDNFEDIFDLVDDSSIDGIVFLGTELCDDVCKRLLDIKIPMVVIDNYAPTYNINCIQANNKEIVIDAIKYLRDTGHKTVGYLRSKIDVSCFLERSQGFREGLQLCNLPYFPGMEFKVTPTMFNSFNELTSVFMDTPLLPSAFFCDNDMIAIGAMKALGKLGYKVPKDVSIIGFGDIPYATYFDPPLTTMHVDVAEIAKLSVQLLMNYVNKEINTVTKVQTSARLVIRKSTR
ncbi:MAG: LacI family transcriptional regulator [Clostridiaceae bacterium]|nr:LacI family transcriptional regulator [Clostridiaceae bacterium]